MAAEAEKLTTPEYLRQPKDSFGGIDPEIIDRLINLHPGDAGYPLNLEPSNPDYPNHPTFEEFYARTSPYSAKAVLAEALIEDGRYKNLGYLVRRFIPKGRAVTPEAKALQEELQLAVSRALLVRGDTREVRKVEDNLKTAAEDLAKGESTDAITFKKLISIFGSSRAVDILFRTRPDFKGLPVDRVKSILADYLGNFLVAKVDFSFNNLDLGRELFSEPNLKEGLTEVIKESALDFCNTQKKEHVSQTDQELFDNYIAKLKLEAQELASGDFNGVVEEVEEYYKEVFEGFKKPESIVDYIKVNRTFPDTPQLINIAEVKQKKRMLIADEMGLGKSANPILVYESIKEDKKESGQEVGPCLITAPSDVISTWQRYLSSKRSVEGKQMGYFKKGYEPKVLTVKNPKQLASEDINSYDYVLISHERLDEEYVDGLSNINFELMAVDEVHKLKNLKGGKRSQNLVKLANRIDADDKHLILLSGTPIPNKVGDIAVILKLLYPAKFENVDNAELVKRILYGDRVDLRSLLIPKMQMKSLSENLEMPNLTKEVITVPMSEEEKLAYEVLREEDEIEASEKLRLMRMFCLNPSLLDISPAIEGSKTKALANFLRNKLSNVSKSVVFVNDYIEGVIRGSNSIITGLNLPSDVRVEVVHGNTTKEERDVVQNAINSQDDKKMVVLVSGQTAGVGRDFSGAQDASFYNEPWTIPDKNQQLHRAYREGREDDLTSSTFILEGSIEEGIHSYIEIKYKAVLKLLKGVPISDVEKELLQKAEDEPDSGLEVNRELAEYYFSSWDKMVQIFAYVKELGEKDFVKFLSNYGTDYAESYHDLGRRSYQANASRISAALIAEFATENPQGDVKILDIASGPEMLKRHITEDLQQNVYSLDINKYHFDDSSKMSTIASFSNIPYQNNAFNYVNLSLGLHYSKFVPSQNNYERLGVLSEMHRVLKMGGRATINLIYSLDIRDLEKFEEIAATIGFKVIDQYSGQIDENGSYSSRVITLEKTNDFEWTQDELTQLVEKDLYNGLKFKKNKIYLRNVRNVLKNFRLAGKVIYIPLNSEDQKVVDEEALETEKALSLKNKYGDIKNIPVEEIERNGFVRIFVGNRYNLFKKLKTGEGVIVIK